MRFRIVSSSRAVGSGAVFFGLVGCSGVGASNNPTPSSERMIAFSGRRVFESSNADEIG